MRCPTPCEGCGEIVELSEMKKLLGGLGDLVCVECFENELEEVSDYLDQYEVRRD